MGISAGGRAKAAVPEGLQVQNSATGHLSVQNPLQPPPDSCSTGEGLEPRAKPSLRFPSNHPSMLLLHSGTRHNWEKAPALPHIPVCSPGSFTTGAFLLINVHQCCNAIYSFFPALLPNQSLLSCTSQHQRGGGRWSTGWWHSPGEQGDLKFCTSG